MQLPGEIVKSSLRFSLGETTTEDQIDEAVRRILHVVGQLR
jgi:cysteine sulfinate desulfinase/cysteine desulfurase-like protein